jgi:hypothetical protein
LDAPASVVLDVLAPLDEPAVRPVRVSRRPDSAITRVMEVLAASASKTG